ncbi:hypothetical protein [Yinghuangia soli]|uniref:Uncharacterized protein n=1 Tax=Yinghuangia soli TaxID=2908204 RepID=A0AA41U4T3_9ACTN|nr:hypothetical protein [Yinghuangia soli]MCF2533280.1 hypothetical protein [Yinghuangia soli]
MISSDASQAIAVRHRPLTVPLVGQLVDLARADWDREAVARLWDTFGWGAGPVPPARLTGTGHPLMPSDEDAGGHTAFFLEFAYHHPDADDEYGEDFLGAEFPWPDWPETLAGDAAAAAFAKAWADAEEVIIAALGRPEVRYTQDTGPDGWNFAAWRLGNRALVLAQGEEFSTYGELEMAALWLVPHPAAAPFPAGPDFYDWLVRPSQGRESHGA